MALYAMHGKDIFNSFRPRVLKQRCIMFQARQTPAVRRVYTDIVYGLTSTCTSESIHNLCVCLTLFLAANANILLLAVILPLQAEYRRACCKPDRTEMVTRRRYYTCTTAIARLFCLTHMRAVSN